MTERLLYLPSGVYLWIISCFRYKSISGKEVRRGGIKVWIYSTYERFGEILTVSFDNSR